MSVRIGDRIISGKIENQPHSIGEIFSGSFSDRYVPLGAVRANGGEYTSAQFPTLWSDFLTSNPVRLMTCTYTEFQNDINRIGSCVKFAVDTAGKKFKVPCIGVGTFLESGNGEIHEAGLPNITGKEASGRGSEMPNEGAFYNLKNTSSKLLMTYQSSTTSSSNFQQLFDASRSSSIYGKSATVQPKSVGIRYYVQLASGEVNQSLFDWAKYTTALDNKADKNLSNVDKNLLGISRVIETKYNSDGSFYRKYSDGWLEQGGHVQANSNGQILTYPKPFRDTTYTIVSGASTSQMGNTACYTKTNTNCKLWTSDDTTFNPAMLEWYAFGKA